jgi:coenzyme F420 hydrogenase subunit beta
VGLFCTWALDTRKLLPVVKECVDDACILAMDVPPPPAEIMVVDAGEERAEIPLSRIRPLVPHGCHVCPDMTSEWADVSVGQVEGAEGWNTLIIRTEKGEQAVEQAVAAGFLELQALSADHEQALKKAAAGKKKRAIEAAEAEGILNTDPAAGRAALRMPAGAVEEIKKA